MKTNTVVNMIVGLNIGLFGRKISWSFARISRSANPPPSNDRHYIQENGGRRIEPSQHHHISSVRHHGHLKRYPKPIEAVLYSAIHRTTTRHHREQYRTTITFTAFKTKLRYTRTRYSFRLRLWRLPFG